MYKAYSIIAGRNPERPSAIARMEAWRKFPLPAITAGRHPGLDPTPPHPGGISGGVRAQRVVGIVPRTTDRYEHRNA